jgi:S-(hydroxymethyl)glutathione dehydrogenase/alcohol dehydrogenase
MPRAAVLYDIATPLVVEDVVLGDPRAGEIEVTIAASGVCHSDLSVQRGVVAAATPIVLGHEAAGIVTRLGPGVTTVSEGDHVVLSWVPSCGTCYWCARGEPYLCASGQQAADAGTLLDGTTRIHTASGDVHQMSSLGTFAERAVVPAECAVRVPTDVALDIAALVGCAVLTGVGAATRTATIRDGDTVVVFGCGGVGLNVVQGARLAGAGRIVAVDTSAAKLALAARFGADECVDATTNDPVDAVRTLTDGRGADVAFEVIGLEATIQQALRAVRRGGETVLVGLPGRDTMLSMRALGTVYGARTVRGSWYGSSRPQQDVPELLALHAAGKLELEPLISATVGLDDVNHALDDLAAGVGTRSVIRFP